MILREPALALDPRVRRYWLLQNLMGAAFALVLVVAGTTVAAMLDATTVAVIVGTIGGLVAIALVPLAFVAAGLDYRKYRYEVGDLGLYVSSGWFWRKYQIVPHARVQTVDTTSGPLMRSFGLVSVEVQTASAEGSTTIPGLTPEVAGRLVEELARRAGIEEGT